MSENQKSITKWQSATFGPTTALLAFRRMQKEYVELKEAIQLGYHDKARDEVADVMITLYRIAECLGLDLHEAVNEKMSVNRARTWDVDANGHGQHR
jgi:NTP pyrophosphatase (non-canonical NTP hydrolase)